MVDDVAEALRLVRGRRVLFVAPSAYPLGGVADWLDYVSEGLERRGWEITQGLVSGRYHDADAYLRRHPWPWVLKIANQTGSPEGRIDALCRTLARVRPDILIVVNQVAVYEAVRRMRVTGLQAPRLVATLHGLQEDLLKDIGWHGDVIDAVVATNRLAGMLAEKALGSGERAFYAPYGVPERMAEGPIREDRDGVVRLLFAGRIAEEQKRVFDLPRVMALLRAQAFRAELTIAGDGPDIGRLRKMFEELDLADTVRFAGILSQVQLASAYQAHDALLVTSGWETGPIVAWEAMSWGLPVVSSRYVGSGIEAALVDGENCLLFDVGDIEGAVRAVGRLRDPGLRRKIVQGGLLLIRSRYSRERSVEQWADAITGIMNLPELPPPRSRSDPVSSGRLDRWLGAIWGERVRRRLSIGYRHAHAGGEWPHSGHSAGDELAFLEDAARVDRPS